MSAESNIERRFSLLGILGGLMVAENLGDVHDEINHLHDLVGLPRPEGSFEEGWTERDWAAVREEQPAGEGEATPPDGGTT